MERKPLSKKLRFEVFKRDKFTCQYCGKKAPDVILQVDHIEPVALGGTNEILNLITSCQECNAGKKAIPLDKDVVLDKQRQQLEMLQERREQIEMMFEWKKSLDNLGDHSSKLLVEYVENIIHPYSLSSTGTKKIESLLNKFSMDEIFVAIDIGKSTYLKYDDGTLIQDSVNNFINKIGGIIFNNRRSPIDNKLSYIRAICKNRFNYWNDQTGMLILKDYVKALKNQGWTDERILKDLETESSDVAKTSSNWSDWRSTMEKWTDDVNSWEKDEDIQKEPVPLDIEEIEHQAQQVVKDVLMFFSLVEYLSVPFEGTGEKSLLKDYLRGIDTYFSNQISALRGKYRVNGDILTIEDLSPNHGTAKLISGFLNSSTIDSDLKFYIDDLSYLYFPRWMDNLYLPSLDIRKEKEAIIFKAYYDSNLENELLRLKSKQD